MHVLFLLCLVLTQYLHPSHESGFQDIPTPPSVTMHLHYVYDTAGRRTSLTQIVTLDAAGQRTASHDSWGTSTYGYDAAGRLVSASYPDGSTEADQYDAGGNRTVITSTTTVGGTSVLTNTFDLADQLTVSHAPLGTTTYTYDGAGRQSGSVGITGIVTTTYNDLGQLTTVVGPGTNASYVYDGQGDRLRSYEQGTRTWTLANDTQDLAAGMSDLLSDGTADYTYLSPGTGAAPLSAYNQSTTRSSYLATDVLGSVRLATDPTGAVIGAGAYDAWGVYRPYTGAGGPIQLAGLQASSPFGYVGQYYDAGPGTYAMRAREYNPTQGRFLSQDPQPYDPQVPITTNPYEYAGDMVTGITDPSGRGWVLPPPGSPDDEDAVVLQATLAHGQGNAAPIGRAGYTTEFDVPLYPTHCGQPAQPLNIGILSLSPDHTQGSFWDIEHVQAYTHQPGAGALTQGLQTHLALPLLQGALIEWGASCADKRVSNPYGGDTCALVPAMRVAGITPGPPFIAAFGLGGADVSNLTAGGRTTAVETAPANRDPLGRVLAWSEAGQDGLILYDRFHLRPDCRQANIFVQVACAYLASRGAPGMGPPEPVAGEGGTTGEEPGAPVEVSPAEQALVAEDASGEATLGEDLGQARTAEETVSGCVGCFAAGTQVATARGGTAIDRLKVGDSVLAENPASGHVESEPVLAVIDDGIKPLLQLDLADGSSIRVTSNHYFWVDSGQGLARPGWLEAGRLAPGDQLRTPSGHDVAVLRIEWNVGDAEVYTLTVAIDHSFFVGADGVLVHNANATPPPPLNDPGGVPYGSTPLSQRVFQQRLDDHNFRTNNYAAVEFENGQIEVFKSMPISRGNTLHAEQQIVDFAKAHGLKIKSLYSELSPCEGKCDVLLREFGVSSDDITYSFLHTSDGTALPEVIKAARWLRDSPCI